MDQPKRTLDASYFNSLYQQNQDPWNFEGSQYEKDKYRETIRMIFGKHYAYIFEIGCSNGLLTNMLKDYCQQLLAIDSSSIAVENAKNRLQHFHHVIVLEMEAPQRFPSEKFDLILLSEVGYFMIEQELLVLRDKIIDQLLPGGDLLLVHWTPFVEEFPLTGDQVHELFALKSGSMQPLKHLRNQTADKYRMDLFRKK